MESILNEISRTINRLNVFSTERLDLLTKISQKTALLEQETDEEKIGIIVREKYDLLLAAGKMDDEVRKIFNATWRVSLEQIEILKENSNSFQQRIFILREVFLSYMLKIATPSTEKIN